METLDGGPLSTNVCLADTAGVAIKEYAVGTLKIHPEDVLVVKVNFTISNDMQAHLKETLERQIPNILCLVIDKNVDLSILTRAEIDARVANFRQTPERIIEFPGG